jgi:hypothetical protein
MEPLELPRKVRWLRVTQLERNLLDRFPLGNQHDSAPESQFIEPSLGRFARGSDYESLQLPGRNLAVLRESRCMIACAGCQRSPVFDSDEATAHCPCGPSYTSIAAQTPGITKIFVFLR